MAIAGRAETCHRITLLSHSPSLVPSFPDRVLVQRAPQIDADGNARRLPQVPGPSSGLHLECWGQPRGPHRSIAAILPLGTTDVFIVFTRPGDETDVCHSCSPEMFTPAGTFESESASGTLPRLAAAVGLAPDVKFLCGKAQLYFTF